MAEREGDGAQPARPGQRSPAARLVGLGARGAGRLAEATGMDVVAEDAIEEAIVRALRSPAVERALVRVIERIAQKIVGRSGEETETDEVGLLTRGLAAGVDLAIVALVLSLGSRLLDAVVLGGDGMPVALAVALALLCGAAFFVAFWSLIGQTPGMRFLSIRLSVDGSREVGLPRALVRILAVALALLPLGAGVLSVLISTTRRGWHDHLAGTTVVYDTRTELAPWAVADD